MIRFVPKCIEVDVKGKICGCCSASDIVAASCISAGFCCKLGGGFLIEPCESLIGTSE